MNKHTTIGIAALAGLGGWAYFAYQWLSLYVIVYPDDDQWLMWSSGLETLWRAWPVLTLGLVLGAILLLACLTLAAHVFAQDEARYKADVEARIRTEKQKNEQQYQQKTSALEAREAELRSGWHTLREQEQKAVQALQVMQARVELAERKAAEAEAKKQRSYGGFERVKRKLQREQSPKQPKPHGLDYPQA